MIKLCRISFAVIIVPFILFTYCSVNQTGNKLSVNDKEYLQKPGLSVLSFHNFYTTGHQGGVEIIQHGERIATNGFIRLRPAGDKRLPSPDRASRTVDKENNEVKALVKYDDFDFSYTVRLRPEGEDFKLTVDLEKPIPASWENRMTFEMEIYPPLYYGKTFRIGESFGIIPRMSVRSVYLDKEGTLRPENMGQGKILTLAAEDPVRKITIENLKGELILTDNRETNKSGWIMVKSVIPAGTTEGAVEWIVRPNVIRNWIREPVISVSQVGYHPDQLKQAVIELDPNSGLLEKARLIKVTGNSGTEEIYSSTPVKWGKFLCYDYALFDFSSVKDPGMYVVQYGRKNQIHFQ